MRAQHLLDDVDDIEEAAGGAVVQEGIREAVNGGGHVVARFSAMRCVSVLVFAP